jgi:S-adenosylmethionine-diacylglycerol 3-amino-3-carboxypropyl transferase
MGISNWISGQVFSLVHGNNLVYNTCWEDPRLDRVALELGRRDRVMVITSAGCNALDYALAEPERVYAVDMNPRQNALLELKIAAIKRLEFEDFFQLFGQGRLSGASRLYEDVLRGQLTGWSRRYWDRRIQFFDDRRCPFYFRGTSGLFARLINLYVDRVIRVRPVVERLLAATDVPQQRQIYDEELKERFWTRTVKFALGRDTTLSLLGVPRAQREQVERGYDGGIVQFIYDCMEAVFARLPIHDNYFWRVYISGSYAPNCCPEYLKPDNFEKLKNGVADRIEVHTNSVQGFLENNEVSITRFVLLDHMDWLSSHGYAWLESEWQAILSRAAPNCRILWRSGGLQTDFVDAAKVRVAGRERSVGEFLTYHPELAAELHAKDRVHTYGSFYIADLAA